MKELTNLQNLVRRLAEAKDEDGNTIYTTYAAWKRAAVKAGAWIEGDEDIAQAMKGEKPFKRGKTQSIGEWDGSEGCIYKADLAESADLAKKLVRGEKGPKGILAKLDHWLMKMMITKDANRFVPAHTAIKALKSYGFSDEQIHKIRDAAAVAANTAIQTMQRKYGDQVPDKYIAKMGTSFNVYDLFLNVSPDIHDEFAALMRKLFDAKIDKIAPQLEIVKEDSNLQALGKGLKGGKAADKDKEEVQASDEPPADEPPAEEPEASKPFDKEEAAEIKVGDIVKPLKGPHKDEPHLVIGISSDGQLEIKPKDLDDTANKYEKKKARIKPENVVLAEGVRKPNMKSVEDKLKAHAQRKIDYEKKYGPMSAGDLVQHENVRKQLLKDLSRERSVAKKALEEAVASAPQKFKKGQKVKVKKTGEVVTVQSQNDIGLVFTASADALKVPDDKKLKAVPGRGYKEYMPAELELVKESLIAQASIDAAQPVDEAIKGWKNAASDIAKTRAKAADDAKEVKLVALKKDGAESKMHDATKKFKDRAEALKHHNNMVKFNPGKTIAHNLYCDGKVEKLSGEQK